MAIDDNKSYELTGAQVKDLANKIKAKAADNIFVGASSAAPGSKGLVPQPQAGDDTKFLAGDGTWKAVQSGSSKRILTWDSGAMYDEDYNAISGGDIYTALQSSDVEVNDSGFSSLIVENGIYASWTDPTYGALSDVRFFTTERTSLSGVMTRTQYLYDEASGNGWLTPGTMNIQEQLTAGSNISISGNTISATVKLVEMAYGESNAWAKFIAAYRAGSIVYCRASSNANPGTGSQTRKAFMAYVNNATNPTNVEFQYVRSQSSKTDSQQCDQVFVYTLTNASGGTWSVASRNMSPKINVSSPITKTFTSGANATVTIGANAMTGATGSTAGAAGVVPAPAAGSQDKFLRGDGTWQSVADNYSTTEQVTNSTWIDGKPIYKKTFEVPIPSSGNTVNFQHGISNLGFYVKAEGVAVSSNGVTTRFLPDFYIDNNSLDVQYGCAIYGGATTGTNITITYGSWYYGGKIYATIWYTKKTD